MVLQGPAFDLFEPVVTGGDDPEFVLHLFVAGSSPHSLSAVERVSRLCEDYILGRYSLYVIDIYQHPAMAEQGQVVAAPTLVRSVPKPLKRIVGNMSDEGRLLIAIGAKGAP